MIHIDQRGAPRKAKHPCKPTDVQYRRFICGYEGCKSTTARKSDMNRHRLLHLPQNEKDLMLVALIFILLAALISFSGSSHRCSLCPFKNLQKKNVEVHLNTQ